MTAGWAELPSDILIDIAERLPSMESYISFGKVCTSWHAASVQGNFREKIFEGPRIMLAEKTEGEDSSEKQGMGKFFCVSSGNKIGNRFLPEARNKYCLPCKDDWLFIVSEDGIHASLLHPLLRLHYRLPRLDTFEHRDRSVFANGGPVQKVVLSANPFQTSSNFVIMLKLDARPQMGFWRPGFASWITVEHWRHASGLGYSDVIYFRESLFAVDCRGTIVRCDVHGPNPVKLHKVFVLGTGLVSAQLYLAEFSNRLFMVHRIYYRDPGDFSSLHRTKEFEIYEVDVQDGKRVKIEDLGNKALFLSYNSSFFIDCSGYNNCKRNCIYFLDDNTPRIQFYMLFRYRHVGDGKDTGIFHLSDGTIEPLFDTIDWSKVKTARWIGPSIRWN